MNPLSSWDSEATWETFVNGNFHGWIGTVEVQKSADDLDRYERLIDETEPDLVIETGTRRGGSALWFRDHGLEVVSFDTNPLSGQDARKQRPNDRGMHFKVGDSKMPDERDIRFLKSLVRGRRVMVSLDADHHYGHVKAEIEFWHSWVTPGCGFVIEDACFEMWEPERARVGGVRIPEWGGPLKAIRETMPLDGFTRNIDLEGMTPISHSPVGWWHRNG